MNNQSDFKVMVWLRDLRDRNSETETTLTVEKRIERSSKQSAKLLNKYLQTHPKAKFLKKSSVLSK